MDRSGCEKIKEKLTVNICESKFCPKINGRCNPKCVCLKSSVVDEGSMAGHYKIIVNCVHFGVQLK